MSEPTIASSDSSITRPFECLAPYGLDCVRIWSASKLSRQMGAAEIASTSDTAKVAAFQGSVADIVHDPGLETSVIQGSLELLTALGDPAGVSDIRLGPALLATFRNDLGIGSSAAHDENLGASSLGREAWAPLMRASVRELLRTISVNRNRTRQTLKVLHDLGAQSPQSGQGPCVMSGSGSVTQIAPSATTDLDDDMQRTPRPSTPLSSEASVDASTWSSPEAFASTGSASLLVGDFDDMTITSNSNTSSSSAHAYRNSDPTIAETPWEKPSSNVLSRERWMIPMPETGSHDWGHLESNIRYNPRETSSQSGETPRGHAGRRYSVQTMRAGSEQAAMQCAPS